MLNPIKNSGKILSIQIDYGLIIQVLLSTFLFSIYCIWYRTPLVADDHRFLLISTFEGFNFWGLGDCISRTPFYGILFYLLLKLNYHTSSFYLFYIFLFAIHSASFYIFTKRLFYNLDSVVKFDGPILKFILPSTIIFVFHPSLYELFTMPGATIYVVGSLFMALTINEKRPFFLILYSFLSFSTYETYIVPIFIISVFPLILNKIDRKIFIGFLVNTGYLLFSFILFISVRFYLSKIVGEYNQIISFDFYNNFLRILRYFSIVSTTGYSGLFSSLIENCFFVFLLVFSGVLKGYKFLFRILLILLLSIVSSLVDIFVSYEGVRIIYGSLIIKFAIFSYLSFVFFSKVKNYLFLIPIFVLGLVYGKNWYSVYKMRLYSYENQKNIENLVLAVYGENEPSKSLLLPPNSVHFHPNDWALENNSIIQPLVFRRLHNLNKEINIKFLGLDSLYFDSTSLPVFYPSRAFLPYDLKKIVRDIKSFSGQTYTIKSNESGIGIFGPYLTLDKGKYSVEILIRLEKNHDVGTIGWIAVVKDFGKTNLQVQNLDNGFLNAREYKSIKLDFELETKSSNIEVQIFSNGAVGFNVDYMRFSKH